MTDPRFYDGEPTKAPVEKKVTSATAASLITAFLLSFVIRSVPGLAALSDVFEAIILAVVTSIVTFVVAFYTKHTPRPDLNE